MANKYLIREDAPIELKTWELLDRAVIESAKSVLSGRRLIHVDGPYGLGLKIVPLGDGVLKPDAPVTSCLIPVSFIHKTFSLPKRDIAAYERDGLFLDAGEAVRRATEVAAAEDTLIFQGTDGAPGLLTIQDSVSSKLAPWDEVGAASEDIINAITALDNAGFHGPYALALPPARYNRLLRRFHHDSTTELEQLRVMATEGVFKAPALKDKGVLVAAGRQFASIVLGQDMSVGFIGPVEERLEFSISESLALIVHAPGSVCVLGE